MEVSSGVIRLCPPILVKEKRQKGGYFTYSSIIHEGGITHTFHPEGYGTNEPAFIQRFVVPKFSSDTRTSTA